MAVQPGINLLIKKGATAIAGLRTAELAFSLTTIDITSADDAGFRKLLNAHTGQQFTLTGSGIEKGGSLFTLWASTATTKYLTDITFTIPTEAATGDLFTADVVLTSYKLKSSHDGVIEFDFTLESAGSWTAA